MTVSETTEACLRAKRMREGGVRRAIRTGRADVRAFSDRISATGDADYIFCEGGGDHA